LIEDNGYSLVKINNDAYKPLKIALRERMGIMIKAQNLFDVE